MSGRKEGFSLLSLLLFQKKNYRVFSFLNRTDVVDMGNSGGIKR
jgi:hypothetical protein